MKRKYQFFSCKEFELYKKVLDFLENVYINCGPYEQGDACNERPIDVAFINFTKVVNDCRAVILLIENSFYIQAAIVTRSTVDACNLMMHIGFEGNNAPLVKQWLEGPDMSHWKIVNKINSSLSHRLNLKGYEKNRRRLDDFVHANYQSVKLYPAQSPGPTKMREDIFHGLSFWKGLVRLHLISCLLTVPTIVPKLEGQAQKYVNRILKIPSTT